MHKLFEATHQGEKISEGTLITNKAGKQYHLSNITNDGTRIQVKEDSCEHRPAEFGIRITRNHR